MALSTFIGVASPGSRDFEKILAMGPEDAGCNSCGKKIGGMVCVAGTIKPLCNACISLLKEKIERHFARCGAVL